MCLNATEKDTKNLKGRMTPKHGKKKFWKVLQYFENGLRGMYHKTFHYTFGKNKGCDHYEVSFYSFATNVYKGIHVFQYEEDAIKDMKDATENWHFKDLIVVPVYAKPENLIASGHFQTSNMKPVPSAVFCKVEIKKSDFVKAVKEVQDKDLVEWATNTKRKQKCST